MDLTLGDSLPSAMARRNVYDPLEPTKEPRWYVVRGRKSELLESRPLPVGTDLKRVLVAAMLNRIDAGWQLGEFSSRGGPSSSPGASSVAWLVSRQRTQASLWATAPLTWSIHLQDLVAEAIRLLRQQPVLRGA
jgi:hypothetical protein